MFDRSAVTYLYDGTLSGFLCCVFEAVYTKTIPAVITARQTLLPAHTIVTEADKAARVQNGICAKIHPGAWEMVSMGFRASVPDKEIKLLRYILLGFKTGPKILNMLSHEDVAPIPAMRKKVCDEAHRMKEFVRFSDYDGALVSVIAPKHDVLELITDHFSNRLRGETFMIFDEARGKAYVYENGRGGIIYADSLDLPPESEEEAAFRRLWQLFYDTVEIKARHNDRCRDNHLPKFYRKNMTEFKRPT